jgi:hypothetical protein
MFGAGMLIAFTLIEAVVLRLLGWDSFWRSLLDSLLINLASIIVVTVLLLTTATYISDLNSSPNTDRVPSMAIYAIMLLLGLIASVIVEGGLLLLRRRSLRKTGTAAILANATTVGAVLLLLLLILG